MTCECYQIGGPFIAEDPNCPVHGKGGLQEELNDMEDRLSSLQLEVNRLREALQEAVNFMKDSEKVSIRSRGLQLESEFKL